MKKGGGKKKSSFSSSLVRGEKISEKKKVCQEKKGRVVNLLLSFHQKDLINKVAAARGEEKESRVHSITFRGPRKEGYEKRKGAGHGYLRKGEKRKGAASVSPAAFRQERERKKKKKPDAIFSTSSEEERRSSEKKNGGGAWIYALRVAGKRECLYLSNSGGKKREERTYGAQKLRTCFFQRCVGKKKRKKKKKRHGAPFSML